MKHYSILYLIPIRQAYFPWDVTVPNSPPMRFSMSSSSQHCIHYISQNRYVFMNVINKVEDISNAIDVDMTVALLQR